MPAAITPSSAWAWRPDVTAVAPGDAVPQALILLTSTVSGNVEGDAPSVRVAYADDTAAQFTAEGADIPESDPKLAETNVYTGKVTQLVPVSREQYAQPNAAALIAASVSRAITRAGNQAYIAQAAPTAPATNPPAGLINISGILTGTVSNSLDALVDLQATVQENNGTPTHYVLSPSAWAALRKLKTGSDYNSSLLGAGVNDAATQLLGLPVLVSPSVPANTGLMLDKNAIVSAVGAVMPAVSDQYYFGSDKIAVRTTWRFGANLVHPERIASFTVS